MYNFILKTQPRSYNGWHQLAPAGVRYAEVVQRGFSRYNRKFSLLQDDLYGIIYYFCKKNTGIDADNISKPIWDVLRRIAYNDDKQVKLRFAGVFDLNTQNVNELDISKLSNKMATDLVAAITDNKCEHILYIEIGILNNSLYPLAMS